MPRGLGALRDHPLRLARKRQEGAAQRRRPGRRQPEEYRNALKAAKAEYEKPFEREAELIEKSQRLSQINASLELDRKDDSGEAVA